MKELEELEKKFISDKPLDKRRILKEMQEELEHFYKKWNQYGWKVHVPEIYAVLIELVKFLRRYPLFDE